EGVVRSIQRKNGKLILISFSDCTVKDEKGYIYFRPEMGVFDMAVGGEIISVYAGAADRSAFETKAPVSGTLTPAPEYDPHTRAYHSLFRQVRACREGNSSLEQLVEVWKTIERDFPDDWLCAMEILEILEHEGIFHDIARRIRIYLDMKASSEPGL